MIEMGSVSDNPIVLPDDDEIVVGRELPRPAGGGGAGRAGRRHSVAGLDLRAPALPPARPLDRTTACRPFLVEHAGPELGVHDRPVHGGLARLRVQVAGASGLGRLDPVVRRSGGPREHGDDGRPARSGRRGERRVRGRARGRSPPRRRSTCARRSSPAAGTAAAHRARPRGRAFLDGGPRPQAPTSTPRSSWSSRARWSRPSSAAVGPLD